MDFIQRKLEYWLADRFERSSDESLRSFGFHKKRWTGKLLQHAERADSHDDARSVQDNRRDGEDY